MTTLNFALSRTAGRDFAPGDEIVVTRLDHDANISPWLELAHDKGLVVRFVDINEDCSLDLDDLERQLSDRTRVVAFPLASNAVGTVTDAQRIVGLAHDAGALAWADAVHFAPHGRIDVAALGVDILVCSPYKFFGPHLGLAYGRPELLARWRPYKVRPQSEEPLGHRFETGTQPFELLAGMVAAIEYVESIGWDAIVSWERELGQRFLDGLPDGCRLHGLPSMDGRVPTFAFTVDGLSSGRGRLAARRARIRGLARQLLRARDHDASRARGRRCRPRRARPLQHRRRGRSAHGRAGAAGVVSVHRALSPAVPTQGGNRDYRGCVDSGP